MDRNSLVCVHGHEVHVDIIIVFKGGQPYLFHAVLFCNPQATCISLSTVRRSSHWLSFLALSFPWRNSPPCGKCKWTRTLCRSVYPEVNTVYLFCILLDSCQYLVYCTQIENVHGLIAAAASRSAPSNLDHLFQLIKKVQSIGEG